MWECCSLTAHEIWAEGVPQNPQFINDVLHQGKDPKLWPNPLLDWSSRKSLFRSPDRAVTPDYSGAERPGCVLRHDAALVNEHTTYSVIKQWYAIVAKDFMARHCSRDSDRLPALQGIASHVQELTGSKYLAGHFEYGLLQSLLWSLEPADQQEVDASFTPSWSWVSVRGKRSVRTIIGLDDSLKPLADFLGAIRLEAPHEGNDHGPPQHYQLRIRGYVLRLGCRSGLSVKRSMSWFMDRGYGYYICDLHFPRATPADSSTRQIELKIEILPDQPWGLDDDMFPGSRKLDSRPFHSEQVGRKPVDPVCCNPVDPVHQPSFLLPIGASIQEDACRALRGLLLQRLDENGEIYRRIGTFRSRRNRFVNELTPEEFSAALFENQEEETVWIR